MGMPACNRCGFTDRFRMIGLMSRWFAAPAGLALEGGYFYLCPACFDEIIQPRWELILDGLLERQRPQQAPARGAEAHTELPEAALDASRLLPSEPHEENAAPEPPSPALPEPDSAVESGPQAAD